MGVTHNKEVDVCPPGRRRRLRRARARGRGDQGDRDGAPRFRRPHRPQARAPEVRAARVGPREVPAGTAVARARSRSSRRGRCPPSWSTITSAGTSTARTRGASACPIDSGRIADVGDQRMRTGIREVVSRFGTDVQLTAQQNILLSGIRAADREAVEAVLDAHGIVTVGRISGLRRNSLACPALPTCGLAISEAERVLPRVLGDLEQVLEDVGLPGQPDRVPHDRLPERLCASVRGRGRAGRALARQVHAVPRRRRRRHAPGAAVPRPGAARLGRRAR